MAPSENTPLLVVPVAPQRQRYPYRTLRRLCSASLGAVLVIALILFLVPYNTSEEDDSSDIPPLTSKLPHKSWPHSEGLSYKNLQEILHDTPATDKMHEWSRYYTSGDHLTGRNLSQAVWTRERWQEFGVHDSNIVSYDLYLNYPRDHRLALLKKSGDATQVSFEASLEEDVLEEDPTTGLPNRVPTFHGYSASGNVTAQFVYANFGTFDDFQGLVDANVSLKGKIAIVKYGRVFRGLKVKRAQELGMVGVLIYDDPQADGEITEENGYKPYPDGPARNPSAAQRGSVQFLSVLPGDPTTPGYPSLPGCERQNASGSTPSIPSIPISYEDALPFLKALNGNGPKPEDFGERWLGGGLGYKGVNYNIGPSPEDFVVNLYSEQEYVTTPIWNVIGTIHGVIPDEVIILGNHRDAWVAGGAGDPNSGSSALNEVVRGFGKALEQGWKPLRTIIFASWDGEEYGLLGSTEWVEDKLPWLSKSNVAYLNVDVAAVGSQFFPSANPLLNGLLYEVTGMVQSPNQTVKGQTVRDVWDGNIGTMGSGSDFTSFEDFAGTASMDMGYVRGSKEPVYHYHSNYDDFHWMERYGDPNFLYHQATARMWALIAAKLVETPVLPLNATDYALALGTYLNNIKPKAAGRDFDLEPLSHDISLFLDVAKQFDAHGARLASQLDEDLPWYLWWKKLALYVKVRRVNVKYRSLNRQFLFEPGLDGRNWFKHVVFAPGLWTGYSGATYPGLVDSFDAGDIQNAEKWSSIIKARVEAATALLL